MSLDGFHASIPFNDWSAKSVKQKDCWCKSNTPHTALLLNGFKLNLLRKPPLLLRTAEYASSVEHEPAGSGTTPACCVRTASKTRTLLCAVLCVPASWTLSITKTYSSATVVRGKDAFDFNSTLFRCNALVFCPYFIPWANWCFLWKHTRINMSIFRIAKRSLLNNPWNSFALLSDGYT